MMKMFRRYCRSEEGVTMVVMALLFPLMCGMFGMGVDISHWISKKRQLQTAADAAALGGAYEVAKGLGEEYAENTGTREAVNNGFIDSAGNSIEFVFFDDEEGNHDVQVNIRQKTDVFLSALFLPDDVFVGTTATAEVTDEDGPYCFLTLNQDDPQAVSTAGTVTIDAQQCGIANNSSSDSALYLNGNVFVDVGDVKLVGDYEVVGGSAQFGYQSLRTQAAAVEDPYRDFEIQDENKDIYSNAAISSTGNSCTAAQQTGNSFNGTVTLREGRYCGGLSLGGNGDVTLAPGTYIIDGGDFNVVGQGTIHADGVVIILTNSGGTSYGTYGNFDVTGGKDMYFSAPTEGYYEGITVFQDRDAPPSDNDGNRLTGNAGLTMNGVFYSPTRTLDFGGAGASGMSAGIACSKLIADKLTFHGTPDLGNNCDNTGTRAIGTPTVKLIL